MKAETRIEKLRKKLNFCIEKEGINSEAESEPFC